MSGTLLIGLYVFVLAAFLGFELITKVPPTLHTPLMSGANAMSGITILGALTLSTRTTDPTAGTLLAFFALILAGVNVVGGLLVTDRLLGHFEAR